MRYGPRHEPVRPLGIPSEVLHRHLAALKRPAVMTDKLTTVFSHQTPFAPYTVAFTGSIRDAMVALERGAEIALVTEGERLTGVLTDGDIRRALLAGAELGGPLAPYVTRRYVAVGPNAGRSEVLELMQARQIGQVPVVDASGRLLGLHRLHDVLGVAVRPNWAVVMAGGRGTRLAPLTDRIPKPMLPVAGRPILERIILHLVGHGVRTIYLSINYLGHVIREYFGDGAAVGADIHYLEEESALGTGGALSLLPSIPTQPIIVMNGDLVTQFNVATMLDTHAAGGQLVTLGVRRYVHTVPFGCIETEGDTIVAMEEKPMLSRLVNAGIYVLDPRLLSRIPRGREFPMPDLLHTCLQRGEMVRAFEITDDWVDVGQRDELQRARGESEG